MSYLAFDRDLRTPSTHASPNPKGATSASPRFTSEASFPRLPEKCTRTKIFSPFFPSGCSLNKYAAVIGISLPAWDFYGLFRKDDDFRHWADKHANNHNSERAKGDVLTKAV